MWQKGIIVHGPLLGHARVCGHDFATQRFGSSEVIMPVVPGSTGQYDYESHVLDGLRLLESLCRQLSAQLGDCGLVSVSGVHAQSAVEMNLRLLHRMIPENELKEMATVKDVVLTCRSPECLV
jgi:hypothetical protein